VSLSQHQAEVNATESWSSTAPDLSRTAKSWLSFKCDPQGQTYIARQRFEYPFHITKPFRLASDPEGMLSLYLQSSSGGLYRGDRLTLDVDIDQKSSVHLTTQANTVVHHTRAGKAYQSTNLRIGASSYCEYLPDPLILLAGADMNSSTRVVVEPSATLVLAESFATHDPKGRDNPFKNFKSELCIEISNGELLAVDRFEINGSTFLSGNVAMQGGQLNQGSMLVVAPGNLSSVVNELRSIIESISCIYGGVSMLPGQRGVWCRFLADDGIALGAVLKKTWVTIRTVLFGYPPNERRK
jgi:urease accessory protein